VPQGDAVLRTYTPTILVMDECDFQPEAHAALAAALPFAEKNAKIILITTSAGPQGVVAEIAKTIGFESFPSSGRVK
jgi:DNA-binding MurR/RpiR family transcriptional regulator